MGGTMISRNDIMEDLQDYMDGLEGDLQRALEREQIWKEHCRALKEELLKLGKEQ
jgi:hypothetical protein